MNRSQHIERLLARAVELDAQPEPGSAVSEIREAALAAGIRADAIDQAISEAEAPASKRAPRRWLERVVAALTGFAVGALADVLPAPSPFESEPTLSTLAVIAALAGVSLMLAHRSRKEAGHLHFQSMNAVLWTGFSIGWISPASPVFSTLLTTSVLFGALSALLGAIWIEQRHGDDTPGETARSVPEQ